MVCFFRGLQPEGEKRLKQWLFAEFITPPKLALQPGRAGA